ncbi:MAG: DUF86 domain-containing protein [Nanoarchaeota archaeon]|nr:DUF86 domain-containing protein [Nanoarchaeota archaeon]
MNRINDKLEEIEKYIQELSEIIPVDFEQYKYDFKTKAACERYSEKIIGAIIDTSFLIIKENRLKIPEEEKQALDILCEESIITNELKERLRDAKGMRNILAHEYGKIDDKIVFESIKDELIFDAEEFIKQIKKFMKY